MHEPIFAVCWWYPSVYVWAPPSQWVGSVLLVLVQWARPCIRQVELEGKFCNTWPVSLTHLCGWRKGGKEKEGESKRKDWMAAQVVRGDWKHEWQWSRKGGRTAAGGSRAGRATWDDGAFTFLLSYFLRLCVFIFHSAASLAGLAELPLFLLLSPSTLKVKSKDFAL